MPATCFLPGAGRISFRSQLNREVGDEKSADYLMAAAQLFTSSS